MPESAWEEMLDEFRALGGTADNICLREGPFGRGLFPRDPSKPVRVVIPENLLVDVKYVSCADGEFRVAPDAPVGARERAFLEGYERNFSWGVSRGETEELLRMMSEAPSELKEELHTGFGLAVWLQGLTQGAIQERFLAARAINYNDGRVVMPIIDLANHHSGGVRYQGETGVELSGRFLGEVLVRYKVCDPLEIFRHWGFASGSELFALSLPLQIEDKGHLIVIGREAGQRGHSETPSRPYFPEVSAGNSKTELSYLLLGHKNYPRLARGIFCKIMREAGVSNPDEKFDLIQHINRIRFYRFLAHIEQAGRQLGRLLRSVIRYQLECMSNSVGTREL